MDGSVMGPTMYSGSGEGATEVEPLSLQYPSFSHHHPHHHHQAYVHHLQGLAPLSTTQHINGAPDAEQPMPKHSLICNKGKSAGTSDEDEPSFTEDGDGCIKGKKESPWHRMKWTDSMVKLLINVVLVVGEDGAVDGGDGSNKRKCGVLQKKGKWKSVSRMMMEKGCFVSPQQCEDKFNDLNKRYKRLNEILGKETACCIVENSSLLDTMDMSQKTKEDVKKILSSKHLFYKEMCSYHNGCKSLASFDLEFQPSIQVGSTGKNAELMECGRHLKDENEMDEEDDGNGAGDEDDGDSDDEDDDHDHDDRGADAEGEGTKRSPFGKHRRASVYEGNFGSFSDYAKRVGMESMNSNLMTMMAGGLKLTPDQWQWMSLHMLQLEEQKIGFFAQALELEKQRFKWQKLSSKKDRENERLRIETERTKLENERMSLQMKQKELEIEFKRSEASIASIALILERLQSNEKKDLGRGQGMYVSS